MTPVEFPQQSTVHNEGRPDATPLHIDPFNNAVTVCYEATPEELEQIKENGGKIYISFALLFQNMPYPILNVSPTLEMRELTEEEKAALEKKAKQIQVKQKRDKRNGKARSKHLRAI